MKFGGNKRFYDFLVLYKVETKPIEVKYKHRAAVYHEKKLRSEIDATEFKYSPPPVEEWKVIAKNTFNTVEAGMIKGVDWAKEKWNDSEVGKKITGKITGFFKKF